jgi:paraquat-inducible protein A
MVATISPAAVTVAAWLYFPLAVGLGWLVVTDTSARAVALGRAAALQTLGSKAAYAGNSVLETVTFGWYDAASRTAQTYDEAVAIGMARGRRASRAAWALAIATATFGLLVQGAAGFSRGRAAQDFSRRASQDFSRRAARYLAIAGLVLFATGVAATSLSLMTAKDVPGIGRVVFRYEAKSILSTVRDLLESHDVVLGGLVLVFSIMVPLLKTALVLFATTAHGAARDRAVAIVHAVGRWSMADVFAVAVLLAMLALGRDPAVRATTGPGLYAFAGSCLLSLWAAAWLPEPSPRSSSDPGACGR